ncbi:MAG: patatin-like phospholipase family protein [Nitriliruptoraceae bacterium]
MSEATRVAVALGSGGARGYAHIGVLEVLEERGYEIVSIAGTSMGALVGGLYAAGSLDEYADWARGLTQRDVIRLLDLSIRGPGAIRATKIFAKVIELVSDSRIEDLSIPFTAVATDLLAGKEVWFQHGPLATAIRASIALPSFITPVMVDGRLLADGGLLNPIPVAATAAATADLTIAVSLSEEHLRGAGQNAKQPSAEGANDVLEQADDPSRLARVRDSERFRAITEWFNTARDELAPEPGETYPNDPVDVAIPRVEHPPAGLRTLEVMQLSLDALQAAVTRYRLASYPPDLLITIPRTAGRALDFHRAGELIALGRERTAAALDRGPGLPWS